MSEGPRALDVPVVVKLGGTTLAEQRQILAEVAELSARCSLVLVHGGGKRLSEWLERLRIESRFEAGLRVTDEPALEVAVAVLAGLVNTELVAALRGLGVDAVGLSGVDGGLLVGQRMAELGRVASVTGIRPRVVQAVLAKGGLPVVAPLATDQDGQVCNVNADDAAAGLAAGLGARLVLLTDTDGVRDRAGNTIPALTADEAERLIARGVIAAGMVAKVRAGLRALGGDGGVAVIANGAAAGALSRALDDASFGTRLRPDP